MAVIGRGRDLAGRGRISGRRERASVAGYSGLSWKIENFPFHTSCLL